jgi:D-amino-acid oxidase
MPFYEPLRDSASGLHIRGHYLQVDIKKLYTNDRGKIFSYNYTPSAEVYRHGDGAPADVYCYPRSDSWILGGSRQPCGATIGSSEMFTNDARARGDTELFPGVGNRPVAVPRAIFELNDQLLEGLTLGRLSLRSLRADRPDAFLGGIGLRFQRSDGLEGVRLSCSRVRLKTEKYIIHNYGHGGSGFTLSWGCAFDLLKMLNSITGQGLRVSLKRNRNLCVHHEIVGMLLLELTQQLIDEHK